MRQASARRRPRVQIMKGYHCSSDSVNLRVLHSVCVSLSGCVCSTYCRVVRRSWCSATDSRPTSTTGPPDSTVYPTVLTVAASPRLLQDDPQTLLILTKAPGSPISTRARRRGRKKKRIERRKKREEQSNFLCAWLFLFSPPSPI